MSRFTKIFAETFAISNDEVSDDLEYQSITSWDSINHLDLVSNLESEFGVEFDMDDIIAMENVAKIKEILVRLGVDEDAFS